MHLSWRQKNSNSWTYYWPKFHHQQSPGPHYQTYRWLIYSGRNIDETSKTSYLDEINDECFPVQVPQECLEDSSEKHEDTEYIMPITRRPIGNAPATRTITAVYDYICRLQTVVHVEIRIPKIENRNIHISPTIDLSIVECPIPNEQRIHVVCWSYRWLWFFASASRTIHRRPCLSVK